MNFKEIKKSLSAISEELAGLKVNAVEKQIILNKLAELYESVDNLKISPQLQSNNKIYPEKEEILIVNESAQKPLTNNIQQEFPEKASDKEIPDAEETNVAAEQEVQEEIKPIEPVTESNENNTPISLLGKFEKNEAAGSLNEKFSGQQKGLNEKLGNSDLKKMIDFNRQFIFINELFNNEPLSFNHTLDRLNQCSDINQAFEIIIKEVAPKYNWDMKSDAVKLFDKIIRQKFGV